MTRQTFFGAAQHAALWVSLTAAISAAELYVPAGDSLQEALNSAVPGDTISVQAGATFTGAFILPNKAGTGWITIRSSLMGALTAGQRVSPSDAQHMAKIVSPNTSPAVRTATGAHHYRITGLEITTAPGVYGYDLVQLGSGSETSLTDLPYAIEVDQVYIHGDPKVGGKRGIALNSRDTKITNSYISDFKSTTQDTQAICGWNGSGPFQILNNYLEATGENVLFGGAVTGISNLVPSDIVIQRNHFFKPLSWRVGDPSYAGTNWIVKNLFEIKSGRRVTLDSNVLENIWYDDQAGIAIQLTVRTERGRVRWAVVEDVTIVNNIIRHAGGGINLLAKDGKFGAARRITVRNNLFEDIDQTRWGGKGRFLQLLEDCDGVVVDHNTIFQTGALVYFAGDPTTGFVYQNNISPAGEGICGAAQPCGNSTLANYAPASVVTANVIAGAPATSYPAENYFPSSIYDARFVDASASNYELASDSPYKNKGTDGKDLGVDFGALTLATSGVVK